MRLRQASRSAKAATLAVLLILPTVAAASSACGGSTTGATLSTPAVASAAAATTAAAPSSSSQTLPVAVQEFHGMLPVITVSSLVKDRPYKSTETVGRVVKMRHAVWTYRQKSSDPRLNGTYDVVINTDQRQDDMSATLWGTSVMRSKGGTWVGRWTGGIAAGGDGHHLYWTMKGTGDYAGLVYHGNGWFVEAGEGFTPDIQIVYAGWIEMKDGSPVPPAPGPGSTPPDLTPVVSIATFDQTAHEGPGPWILDVAASDSRVSGLSEGTLMETGDARSDDSVDYSGEWTLTNEAGTWESRLLGVRGPGMVEHFQYVTGAGSGAYAGLISHELSHFLGRRDYVAGDTFIQTGWIEEAQ